MNVIETRQLSKSYGSTRALRDCTLAIPDGHVVALVGPNGAGKSTLLNLSVGLATPSAGDVRVLGGLAAGSPPALGRIAFVAEDTPLFKNLSAADLLHMTRNLNLRFDQAYAEHRLNELGIPLQQKVRKMSGGQQAQLALTLALARRPQLLVLDEPMAMLDPLARHDFMATVMTAVADDGVSVVLSSHVLAEFERVADYLVLLSHGSVQVAGQVDDLLAAHRVLTGPAAQSGRYVNQWNVVHASCAGPLAHLLVRGDGTPDPVPPGWEAHSLTLEELTLDYLREPGATALPGPARTPHHDAKKPTKMTTAATSAVPGREQARSRRVPWWRMAWVIWRQHRLAIAGVLALLAVAAALVMIEGIQLHHAYTAVTACRPAGSAACLQVASSFSNDDSFAAGIVAALLQAVPALIGAFAGAPLLAGIFESGTFRYVFTQGFRRTRWVAAKLVSLAVVVAVAAGAFSAVFSWAYGPLLGKDGYGYSALVPTFFDLRGVAFAAWTLAAFAIGVFAGELIRRVLPAMFATLAAWSGLAFATALFLRPHYRAALQTTNPGIGPPARVISQWWTLHGKPVDLTALSAALRPVDVRVVSAKVFSPGPSTPEPFNTVHYLLMHGFTLVASYQPGSWFWPFQWIEGGWLLVLSVLLGASAIWLVRRRAV